MPDTWMGKREKRPSARTAAWLAASAGTGMPAEKHKQLLHCHNSQPQRDWGLTAQLSDLHPWGDNLTYGHSHWNSFSIAVILTLSSMEKRAVCLPLEMQFSTAVRVLSTAAVLLQTVISGIIATKC